MVERTGGTGVEIVVVDWATRGDSISSIVHLVNEVYLNSEDGLWVPGTLRTSLDEVASAIRDGQLALARQAETIVGAVRLQLVDSQTGGLSMLVADTQCRGLGIGTLLVDFAHAWARRQGLAAMQLEVLTPRNWAHPSKVFLLDWYGRIGYQQMQLDPVEVKYPTLEPLLATPCDLVVFRKDLASSPLDRC